MPRKSQIRHEVYPSEELAEQIAEKVKDSDQTISGFYKEAVEEILNE